MTKPVPLSRSRRLERLGFDLLNLASEADQPSHTSNQAEHLIAEAERIAAAVRAEFRG